MACNSATERSSGGNAARVLAGNTSGASRQKTLHGLALPSAVSPAAATGATARVVAASGATTATTCPPRSGPNCCRTPDGQSIITRSARSPVPSPKKSRASFCDR